MRQLISKKLFIYFFLFIFLVTINNKNLSELNFYRINDIKVFGLNEEENLRFMIPDIAVLLKNSCSNYEIIIVDDNSTDQTTLDILSDVESVSGGQVRVFKHDLNK